MFILAQFSLRLSFGLALAMALTSPRQVTSGYFRNHAYVLLGLNLLAALAALASGTPQNSIAPFAATVLSYLCSAVWLYEKRAAGRVLLVLAAGAALAGAWIEQPPWAATASAFAQALFWLAPPTSGLVLGSTIAAMFLGHWYLNSPSMELAPLRRLMMLMAGALAVRAAVCAAGFAFQWPLGLSSTELWLVGLRWAAGIVGTAALTWMAWQTLKIPNTQSATGILYVAVIATFLGELTGSLLSATSVYPL